MQYSQKESDESLMRPGIISLLGADLSGVDCKRSLVVLIQKRIKQSKNQNYFEGLSKYSKAPTLANSLFN